MISLKKVRKVYKPDLDEFIALCEANYTLIIKLLPFLAIKKNEDLSLTNKRRDSAVQTAESVHVYSQNGSLVSFKVIEKAKYTTTLVFQLKGVFYLKGSSNCDKMNVNIMLRAYHDAQLLEVMDESGYKAIKAVIKGDKLNHQQADEKRQLNRFVQDSLKYCLQLPASKKGLKVKRKE